MKLDIVLAFDNILIISKMLYSYRLIRIEVKKFFKHSQLKTLMQLYL